MKVFGDADFRNNLLKAVGYDVSPLIKSHLVGNDFSGTVVNADLNIAGTRGSVLIDEMPLGKFLDIALHNVKNRFAAVSPEAFSAIHLFLSQQFLLAVMMLLQMSLQSGTLDDALALGVFAFKCEDDILHRDARICLTH